TRRAPRLSDRESRSVGHRPRRPVPCRNRSKCVFIELDNLVVHYGKRRALDGMCAALNGKSIGLLGPNGAGKSTLIRTLLGFIKPTSGTARVLGMDVRRDQMRIRQVIGYMPEHSSFIKG